MGLPGHGLSPPSPLPCNGVGDPDARYSDGAGVAGRPAKTSVDGGCGSQHGVAGQRKADPDDALDSRDHHLVLRLIPPLEECTILREDADTGN